MEQGIIADDAIILIRDLCVGYDALDGTIEGLKSLIDDIRLIAEEAIDKEN